MASLICWSSGMLQVVPSKQVPGEPGEVLVLTTGAQSKLQALMSAHAEHIEAFENWYVPGTQAVATEGRSKEDIEMDRMALVILFTDRLRSARKAAA